MNINQFFQELKRRNVYRVAVSYAVVAWLIVQIVSDVGPMLELPDSLGKTVLILLLVGFPVALILAWAFEMSPEGFIRTTSDVTESNPYPGHRKKPQTSNLVIGILLAIILGQFVFNRYFDGSLNSSDIEKTIAVLPFSNESSSIENLYFCNGVLEGVLDHLAKIPELKVISRTSVEQYRDSKPSLKKIAQELGINYLVEGSVLRVGERVVVYAQLIYVKEDKHLWSQKYSRDLTDIFAIQAEIAQSIAEKLHTIIAPEVNERIESRPTLNMEAYRLLLEAQYNLNLSGFENIRNAVPILEEAIRLDPDFAHAYAELARTYVLNIAHVDPALEWDKKAYMAFQEALRLNPNLAEAYVARGLWYWIPKNNFQHENAIKDFIKAISLKPSLSTAYESLTLVQIHIGMLDQAIKTGLKGIELEPTSSWMRHFLGQSYYFQGEYDEALRMYESINEDFLTPFRITLNALSLYYQNMAGEAIAIIEDGISKYPTDSQMNSSYAILLASMGRHKEARNRMDISILHKESLRHVHHLYHNLASASAIMGEKEEAVNWLRKASDNGFPCYPLYMNDPNLKNLKGYDSYEELMAELKELLDYFNSI